MTSAVSLTNGRPAQAKALHSANAVIAAVLRRRGCGIGKLGCLG
jgi:hypothetical protein